MNSRAQAGLEYLLTYGWVLVLVAAVVATIVMLVNMPSSQANFSSSDPGKISIKSGSSDGTISRIVMQNLTGGKITITGVTSEEYENIRIEDVGSLAGIEIASGSAINMEAEIKAGKKSPSGIITMSYIDYGGFDRSVDITISGTITPPLPECGNGIIEAGEECDVGTLNGKTCITEGYTGGTLSCNPTTCQFDTSGCTSTPVYLCNGTPFTPGRMLNAGQNNGYIWNLEYYEPNWYETSGTFACPNGTKVTTVYYYLNSELGYDFFKIGDCSPSWVGDSILFSDSGPWEYQEDCSEPNSGISKTIDLSSKNVQAIKFFFISDVSTVCEAGVQVTGIDCG